MNNRLIRLVSMVAVLLGLNAGLAHAIVIGTAGETKSGHVWEGESVTRTIRLLEPTPYVGSVGVVITTVASGKSISTNDFADLPIRLLDKNLGETDLYLTLVGSASLKVGPTAFGPWTPTGEEWNSGDFSQSKTKPTPYRHLHKWDIPRPHAGEVKLTLKPVIFCVPPPGKTTCTIPSGKINFTPLFVRLYTSKNSFREGEALTMGGQLEGVIPTYRPCQFTVENTAFDVVLEKRKEPGLMVATSKTGNLATSLKIYCPDGKPPSEVVPSNEMPKGLVKVRLSPQHGTVPESSRMAQTSHQGVGLIYRLGDKPISCTAKNNGNFNADVGIQTMKVTSWKEQDPITKKEMIHWGFCQRDSSKNIKPGAFNTSVDYVLWLE